MIQLIVKTLDNQDKAFTVDDQATVYDLKLQIRDELDIPLHQQRLIFAGQLLSDHSRLAEHRVNGKVIHLVPRPPPCCDTNGSNNAEERQNQPSANNSRNRGPHIYWSVEEPTAAIQEVTYLRALNPVTGRLDSIRRLMVEIRNSIGYLNCFSQITDVSDPAAPITPIPIRHPPLPPSRQVLTSPIDLATLLEELDDIHREYAPYRRTYMEFLRDGRSTNGREPVEGEELNRRLVFSELVGDVNHGLAHIYHTMSDMRLTMDETTTSLTVDEPSESATPPPTTNYTVYRYAGPATPSGQPASHNSQHPGTTANALYREVPLFTQSNPGQPDPILRSMHQAVLAATPATAANNGQPILWSQYQPPLHQPQPAAQPVSRPQLDHTLIEAEHQQLVLDVENTIRQLRQEPGLDFYLNIDEFQPDLDLPRFPEGHPGGYSLNAPIVVPLSETEAQELRHPEMEGGGNVPPYNLPTYLVAADLPRCSRARPTSSDSFIYSIEGYVPPSLHSASANLNSASAGVARSAAGPTPGPSSQRQARDNPYGSEPLTTPFGPTRVIGIPVVRSDSAEASASGAAGGEGPSGSQGLPRGGVAIRRGVLNNLPNTSVGTEAQTLAHQAALNTLMYDPYWYCNSMHAEERISERRFAYMENLMLENLDRCHRSLPISIERLEDVNIHMTKRHMARMTRLLSGPATNESALNAFLVSVARALYLEPLSSAPFPRLIPQEFYNLRKHLRNYFAAWHAQILEGSERCGIYDELAGGVLENVQEFIETLPYITPIVPNVDPCEVIRACLRENLPLVINNVFLDLSTEQFVDCFFEAMLKFFKALCVCVMSLCRDGFQGFRRVYTDFIEHVTEEFDTRTEEWLCLVARENLLAIQSSIDPNTPSDFNYQEICLPLHVSTSNPNTSANAGPSSSAQPDAEPTGPAQPDAEPTSPAQPDAEPTSPAQPDAGSGALELPLPDSPLGSKHRTSRRAADADSTLSVRTDASTVPNPHLPPSSEFNYSVSTSNYTNSLDLNHLTTSTPARRRNPRRAEFYIPNSSPENELDSPNPPSDSEEILSDEEMLMPQRSPPDVDSDSSPILVARYRLGETPPRASVYFDAHTGSTPIQMQSEHVSEEPASDSYLLGTQPCNRRGMTLQRSPRTVPELVTEALDSSMDNQNIDISDEILEQLLAYVHYILRRRTDLSVDYDPNRYPNIAQFFAQTMQLSAEAEAGGHASDEDRGPASDEDRGPASDEDIEALR